MTYTLPEVKKEIKAWEKNMKGNSVNNIVVLIEEFGEGFDTHVDINLLDKWLNEEFKSFQVGEEEKLKKAEARAQRIVDSLVKLGYKAEWEKSNC